MTKALGSIVSNKEAEALKDMIFKRASERALSLESTIKESYTSNTQNDIMELARNSFSTSKNPFSIVQNTNTEKTVEEAEKKEDETIGFPKRKVKEVKVQIEEKNKEANEKISELQISNIMIDAHTGLNKKTSFMGALDFLNTQASIALINQKSRGFDATA